MKTSSPADDKKYVKLIMVTGNNNNKFYEMVYNGGANFTCNYGRVESTQTTITKPFREWDSVYREKTKKGYKDITDMVAVEVTENKTTKEDFVAIQIAAVNKFIELMRKYTDDLVKKTYSVKADKVSHKQIQHAQAVIDELVRMGEVKDEELLNSKLIELYGIIPRFMKNVKNCLLPELDLEKALIQEQDNLDAMASQVAAFEKEKENNIPSDIKEKKAPKQKTYLDTLNLNIIEATDDAKKNLKYILDQLTKRKITGIFEVAKNAEDIRFEEWIKEQKDVNTRYLIHGTRCTSVIPILREGLKVRPSGNFQFSGKVYGEGNYFAEFAAKSLNYTGYDDDQILLIYEVHTGNPFTYEGWYRGNKFTLNYNELKKRGFDSTYVKPGNGLQNSEIIAYREEQARIKYIIHLKRK